MLHVPRHLRVRSWVGHCLLACLLIATCLVVTGQSTVDKAGAATDTGTKIFRMVPNVDATKTSWTQNGVTAGTYYNAIDDDPGANDEDTTRIYGPSNTDTNNTATFDLTNMPSDFGSALSVRVLTIGATLRSTAGQDDTEKLAVALSTGGDVTALTSTSSSQLLSDSWDPYTYDLPVTGTNSKAAFDAARLKLIGDYTVTGGADTGTFMAVTAVAVEVTYLPTSNLPKLNQDRYIWENDDEDQATYATPDNADENTQQAPGNTAITGVRKGERLSARVQIRNSGDALANRDLALFYDRNDGVWSKVQENPVLDDTATNCSDTSLFDCTSVESSSIGANSSIAIDSSGYPWIVSRIAGSAGLRLSHYVGKGGNCVSGAWSCETIYNSGTSGDYASIVLDKSNTPWISFIAATNDLYVARFVGTGGTGCVGASNSSAWTCTAVDTPSTVTGTTSIALDQSGNPWVSYYDASGSDLKVAKYSGSWALSTVDSAVNGGNYNSLAFDQSGAAWISYYDAGNGDLKVAKWVSSWTLTTVDSANTVGQYTSIAIAPDGYPRIAYYDATGGNLDLRMATYNGAAWGSAAIDTTGDVGMDASIAFAPDGNPWVVSYVNSSADLRLSRYNGSTWTNTSIDTTGNVGVQPDIAFSSDGTAWISSYSTTDAGLKVLHQARSGEIITGSALARGHNNPIAESHADMTAVPDNTNRDDADCSTGTWNNGIAADSANLSGLSLPVGSGTSQCTEVAFLIDTSRASLSQQYRFVIASRDSWRVDKGTWRGPVAVSAYPTMTMAAAEAPRISKDAEPVWPTCPANSNYECTSSFMGTGFDYIGSQTQVAYGPDGSVWATYDNYNGGNTDLWVSHYVGSGGTGCVGTTAWTCVAVETSVTVGYGAEIAIGPDGTPWLAYLTNASTDALRYAHYVGSGGTGCATTAWTCGNIDAHLPSYFSYLSITVDQSGSPWVTFTDTVNTMWAAMYVGSGGTGCDSQAWSCTSVLSNAAYFSHMTSDSAGRPWIAGLLSGGLARLYAAHYVGTGGTGCNSAAWTCYIVESSASYGAGSWSGVTVDGSGTPWITYRDETNTALKLAHYVGSGGQGCNLNSWTCETIDNSGDYGTASSIAIGADGTKWLVNKDDGTSDLRVVHSVTGAGSGGGCATGWVCETVRTGGVSGTPTNIVIDPLGVPTINWLDASWVSWLVKPVAIAAGPDITSAAGGAARNGRWTAGRYSLDSGYSPRSSTCGATAGNRGYCGVASSDSDYDSMTAEANESPLYTFGMNSTFNDGVPVLTWTGKSTVAPSSKAITPQVWNNTTGVWDTLTTSVNSCTAASPNTDCTITGKGTGAAQDYYKLTGGTYWSYFRVRQAANTAAMTLSTNVATWTANRPPKAVANLAQTTTGNSPILTGKWTNSTTVKFTGDVGDLDSSDTDALCVEVQPVTVAFTNSETVCAAGVPYSSNTMQSTSVSIVVSDNTLYHWQARAKDAGGVYSGWQPFDVNSDVLTAETDFGVDTTAPSTGTVYDGVSPGVDAVYNTGSLSVLSANWSGFADVGISNIESYDYSIGTAPNLTDTLGWTNTTSTWASPAGLNLHTNQMYYFNVLAKDYAGNVSAVVNSNGQFVAPTLSFSISSGTVTLALHGSFNDSQSIDLKTSTNAYSGYTTYMYAKSSLSYGAQSIAAYGSGWNAPSSWSGYGFGYTSSDTDVAGQSRFTGGKYAGVPVGAGAAEIVDDHTPAVDGLVQSTPLNLETFTVTLKVQTPTTQAAGTYTTSLVFSVVAQY